MFGLSSFAGAPFTALEGQSAASNWQNVYNAQAANWQNVNNAQSSGWAVITDEQTPGWVLIPT